MDMTMLSTPAAANIPKSANRYQRNRTIAQTVREIATVNVTYTESPAALAKARPAIEAAFTRSAREASRGTAHRTRKPARSATSAAMWCGTQINESIHDVT